MQLAMTWSMTTWARLVLAATLVVAAFFVVPVADAATCVPELPAAHASVDHDPSQGDHTGSAEHGICAHGHCHHTASARAEAGDDLPLQVYSRPVHAFPVSEVRASIAPDGLIRPPRA